jgi:hypothetical protein
VSRYTYHTFPAFEKWPDYLGVHNPVPFKKLLTSHCKAFNPFYEDVNQVSINVVLDLLPSGFRQFRKTRPKILLNHFSPVASHTMQKKGKKIGD